ncbi:MAG: penicillin-binding protein 2 [Gammaproteobacteria bacterium]|nr:penicillin-binding protein 2 [Gammaproteobacteria bacterium]
MVSRLKLGSPGTEFRLVRGRVLLCAGAMALLVLAIIARVSYLQIALHDHFTTLSRHNRVKIVPIPPIRGRIFSRDGVLLADNRPSFSLEIVPEQVTDMTGTIEKLGQLVSMSQADLARFRDQAGKMRLFESVPLRFNLTEEEVARVSIERHALPGVEVVARLDRFYPLGADVAHSVGYVGMIDDEDLARLDRSDYSGTTHIGKLGAEKAFEDLLHGHVGFQQVEVNAQGRVVRVLDRTAPMPGRNLYLTLDISLQTVAAKALAGRRGAIVALDPQTGSVLALVSSPSYDPNPFVNGISSADYQALLDSPAAPLLNRALQGKYPPGSTIKPFLALAALDFGVRAVPDSTWCPGWFALKGSSHQYRDWKKRGHGHVDLTQAVAQSCDVYFYTLANDLGIDRLYDALDRFGFGHPTGIDIKGESKGLIPSRAWKQEALKEPWYPGETLIMGIGQGYVQVTPAQLALATAIMASRGRAPKPRLLDEARDVLTGDVVLRPVVAVASPTLERSESHWAEAVRAMREVMHGPFGTARRSAQGATYESAGKTGTAQLVGMAQDEAYRAQELAEELRDHALFIAFAPLDAPRIAVAIIVENGGSGSGTAAPIARELFDHYLGVAGPSGAAPG